MFSGNQKLFKELWLEHSDWSWEKHPVIHLDMTLVAGKQNNAKNFIQKLSDALREVAEQ